MSLYTKRISELEVEAANLRDQKGEPIDSVVTGRVVRVLAGDKTLVISVSKDGKFLDVELFKKSGYSKQESVVRMSL